MLVVVGSRFDAEAQGLVASWSSQDAALLACEDLSRAGWRISPGDWRASTAVIGGAVVPMRSIRGVLTRRPQVFEAELGQVTPQDREYVVAEMNAFLLCWLAMLPCPVLNPPTPTSLSGPNWSRQQWVHAAAHAGVRVRPLRANPGLPPVESNATAGEVLAVTVVGAHCFGAPNEDIAALTRRLAVAAGVALLTVRFEIGEGPPTFLDADPFPKLSDPAVANAVLGALLRGDTESSVETRTQA